MRKSLIPLTIISMLMFTGCATTGGENADVEIVTSLGSMHLDLYEDKAPETVKNFKELAKSGKYDGSIFHRIIKDFMIQGGDFENRNGTGGYSYKGVGTSILDEFGPGLTHEYGTLSMANAGPNTGSSQFFIVNTKAGTPFLDGKHAIFGKVTEGFDVLEEISNVKTEANDRPAKDVVIKTIKIND